MEKKYLGDGVYAQTDGYHIILTTENGISISNTIYLDENVTSELLKYLENIKK